MSPREDMAVGVTNAIPVAGAVNAKPNWLLSLSTKKAGDNKFFITLDKPELLNGFVSVRGIYCNMPETKILSNFSEVLTSTKKELYYEVLMPWHRILDMRSLVFRQK